MPVLFRGHSEYKTNYKWTPSYRSGSFIPKPDQAALDAGLRSDQIGATQEPSFTIKKKVWHRDSEVQNCLVWWPDSNSEDQENSKVKSVPREEKPKVRKSSPKKDKVEKERGDNIVVRESQTKKQKPRSSSLNGSLILAPRGDAVGSRRIESNRRMKDREEIRMNRSNSRTTSPSKRNKKAAESANSPPKNSKQTQTPSPKQRKERIISQTPKSPVKSAPPQQKSPTKEPKENIALQRRAGLTDNKPARTSRARLSEYQRCFMAPRLLVKPSPLLSALDVVHSSSAAIPPYSGLRQYPSTTTYLANFKKEGSSPLSRSLPASSPASPSMKPKVKDIQNPQKPFFTHAKRRNIKSEYSSQYEANQEFQVGELRKMAEDNKQRHEGTHIDPDHATQVVSRFNTLNTTKCWEASSVGSSEQRDEEEEKQDPRHKGRKTYVVRESNFEQSERSSAQTSPRSTESICGTEIPADSLEENRSESTPDSVVRKLAWGEEEENERESQQDENEDANSIASGSMYEGRLATPKLQALGGAQRTHHDLTTPCRGGALLVSPSRQRKNAPSATSTSISPEVPKELRSPVAGAPTLDAQRLLNERAHPLVRSSPSRSPMTFSLDKRQRASTAKEPLVRRETPVKEKASKEAPEKPVMRHTFVAREVRAPIKGMLRSEEFQHCGPTGRHPSSPAWQSRPLDDDALSVASSMTSVRASDLLRKAQERKSFWTTK